MRKLLLCLLVAIAFTTVSAQDPQPTAFMRAMALAPFAEFVIDSPVLLSYADYHSGLAARGLTVPATWTELMNGSERNYVWAALPAAGPERFLQNLGRGGEEYETLLGFDFFDAAQGVEIGMPPSFGQILIGEIDPQAVEAAYAARNYTAEAIPDAGTLLCPEVGCDTGMAVDMANLNPANPFGGNIGRSEPALVTEDVFLNAPTYMVLQTMIETLEGEGTSFADLPEVQAIGTVLSEYPYVNAVTLINPLSLALPDPASILGEQITPELADQLLAEIGADLLPAYNLAALAATADENGEYALAILPYKDAASAETAAARIDTRLASINSQRADMPYSEAYAEIGQLEPAQVVTDEETGLSLVVLRIASPNPPLEAENGLSIVSNRLYGQLMNGYEMRDLLWLAWGGAE